MARAYLKEDGTLDGIYQGPEDQCPHHGQHVAILPEDGRQSWSGSAWTWPVERARERRILEVNGIRDRWLQSAPCPLAGGRGIALDDVALARLDRTARLAQAVKVAAGAVSWPPRLAQGGWQMADGSSLPLPRPDDLIRLRDWAMGESERLHDVAWAHIEALHRLRGSEEVAAHDTGTGWRA
jgi:hypothetical protein